MSRGDMQRVGAGLRRPERDLPAFGERQAAGKEVFDREPVDDAQAWHRGFHRAQNFEAEAGAIFQAAAIFVVAPVLERRVELRNQIAVRGVDLDAIEAGLLRALRRGDVSGDGLCDARLGHGFRDDGLERGLVDRMRNGRRRDRCLAANVDPGMAAAVAELDRRLGAAAMDLADEPRQAGNEMVIVDADLVAAMSAALFRRGHLDCNQAHAAADARHVIGDQVVGDETLRVRRARGHRRHDDAVFDFDRPDAGGREEDVHRIVIPGPSAARNPESIITVAPVNSLTCNKPHSLWLWIPGSRYARPGMTGLQRRYLAAVEIDGRAVHPGGARGHQEGDHDRRRPRPCRSG